MLAKTGCASRTHGLSNIRVSKWQSKSLSIFPTMLIWNLRLSNVTISCWSTPEPSVEVSPTDPLLIANPRGFLYKFNWIYFDIRFCVSHANFTCQLGLILTCHICCVRFFGKPPVDMGPIPEPLWSIIFVSPTTFSIWGRDQEWIGQIGQLSSRIWFGNSCSCVFQGEATNWESPWSNIPRDWPFGFPGWFH